jgi:hypothetical protein
MRILPSGAALPSVLELPDQVKSGHETYAAVALPEKSSSIYLVSAACGDVRGAEGGHHF